jgi:DNA (cytosine-5)-methyltransferase 1
MENPAAILTLHGGRSFAWILGELAALGFNAEWSVLSACTVGAPHVRERLFIVAYTDSVNGSQGLGNRWGGALFGGDRSAGPWRDPVNGFMEAHGGSRRVVDGVPDRMEPSRVKALGNAVVPQVAECIGRLITGGSR